MGKLDGKVALISGGARGQGAAEAETFAREGAKVVFGDIRDTEGEKVEAAIRAAGGEATYVHLNVTSEADWQAAVQTATERYGRLDILMNNAACGRSASVVEQRLEDWDEVFASTVRAAYLGSKYAIPLMLPSGGGSIINTASVHGLLGGSSGAAYDSAKAALLNLSRQIVIAQHLGGIVVISLLQLTGILGCQLPSI